MEYADKTKLRAYFVGNLYISQIQHGIQAGHVVTKLAAKYGRELSAPREHETFYDWADNGVTKILLVGGYQSTLETVYEIFKIAAFELELPFEWFHEEKDALNGALTSVGVIVPEEVYGFKEPPPFVPHGFDFYPPPEPFAHTDVDATLAYLQEIVKQKDEVELRPDFIRALHYTLRQFKLA